MTTSKRKAPVSESLRSKDSRQARLEKKVAALENRARSFSIAYGNQPMDTEDVVDRFRTYAREYQELEHLNAESRKGFERSV